MTSVRLSARFRGIPKRFRRARYGSRRIFRVLRKAGFVTRDRYPRVAINVTRRHRQLRVFRVSRLAQGRLTVLRIGRNGLRTTRSACDLAQ